jgi:hypothetical protein
MFLPFDGEPEAVAPEELTNGFHVPEESKLAASTTGLL